MFHEGRVTRAAIMAVHDEMGPPAAALPFAGTDTSARARVDDDLFAARSSDGLSPAIRFYVIAWNIVSLLALALFAYLAYVRRIEFLVRRYPLIVIVQSLAINCWANAYFQSPTTVPWLPAAEEGPLGSAVIRFFLSSVTCPIWIVGCHLRAFSFIVDHFNTVKMMHESSKDRGSTPWTDLLTPTERRFFRWLDWALNGRALPFAPRLSRAPTDGRSSAGLAANASNAVQLSQPLTPTKGAVPASRSDLLQTRRISTRTQAKVMAASAALGVAVLIPAGMAASACFAPASSPGAAPFPECIYHARVNSAYKYYPLLAVLAINFVATPFVLLLVRRIRDQYYLRLEILSHLVVLFLELFCYVLFGALITLKVPRELTSSSFTQIALLESYAHTLIVPTVYCAFKYEAWPWQRTRRVSTARARMPEGPVVHLEYTTESFKQMLQNDDLFEKFQGCLAAGFCLENGLFWQDLAHLESITDTVTPLRTVATASRPTATVSRTPFTRTLTNTSSVVMSPMSPFSDTATILPTPPSSSTAAAAAAPTPSPPPRVDPAVHTALLRLFHTYVAADSPRELNLPSWVREAVAADVKCDRVTLASFADVKNEVFLAMYTNTFPRFLSELADAPGEQATLARPSATGGAGGDGDEVERAQRWRRFWRRTRGAGGT
ncbi:hypothetical protein AMAG_06255 [Allomyces macrogynus ATCC 38327]|uniref:RGS domain-containing protein n=1 Tax=Allomyces macrogynus (strain ATCC 38327) TaxID=578462 RepID=A0A0L0SGA7_ALLM3|nr:hypothetical protein AMAG_06255 [Allomyces macrogynus ATCC 38327]|eukprot:KNE61425.1 hypothetical protein AMAG_06255 [Allomyces macrogynus ATCC 38327]